MSQSDAVTVFHVPESPSRGGRKQRYLKVDIGCGLDADCKALRPISSAIGQKKHGSLPDLIKLSKLPEHLRVSKSSVYRMTKNGLKTRRPTCPTGDQYVRREDLEEYLAASALNAKPRRGKAAPK
jgi:hypothetical protein